MGKHTWRTSLLTSSIAFLAATPTVFAAELFKTGISPLNNVLTVIGTMFNIDFGGNKTALIGVVKFLLFILLYTVLNWAARKVWDKEDATGKGSLDKKTANIVAGVLAALSIFFIPNDLILDISSIWAAAIWLILLLGIPGILVYLAFSKFGNTKDDQGNVKERAGFGKHMLGALLCMMALYILLIFFDPDRGSKIVGQLGKFGDVVDVVLSWAYVIISFCIVIKLVQAIFNVGAGGFSVDDLKDKMYTQSDQDYLDRKKAWLEKKVDLQKRRNELYKAPSAVDKFTVERNGAMIELDWTPNPATDDVLYYDLAYSHDNVQTLGKDNKKVEWTPVPGYNRNIVGFKLPEVNLAPRSGQARNPQPYFRIFAVNKIKKSSEAVVQQAPLGQGPPPPPLPPPPQQYFLQQLQQIQNLFGTQVPGGVMRGPIPQAAEQALQHLHSLGLIMMNANNKPQITGIVYGHPNPAIYQRQHGHLTSAAQSAGQLSNLLTQANNAMQQNIINSPNFSKITPQELNMLFSLQTNITDFTNDLLVMRNALNNFV